MDDLMWHEADPKYDTSVHDPSKVCIPGITVYTFNLNTKEVQAGGYLWVWGQSNINK